MKFLTANKDSDGYYNFSVQLDETSVLSPVKSFRYGPFVPRLGVKNDSEAQYVTDIQNEVKAVVLQLKAAWIAAGSPAQTLPALTTTTPLALQGSTV